MTDMCPNKLHGIEFGRTDWKAIDVQARLALDKLLHQTPLMDGMVIPNQNKGTCYRAQDLFEKEDHLFTTQTLSKGSHRQFYFPAARADQESTQQVQALMMIQAGAHTGCLSARSPAAAQGRDQRKSTFIFQNQPGAQLTAFFLSWAADAPSNSRSLPRPAEWPGVAPVDCSSPCGSANATRRSAHNAP